MTKPKTSGQGSPRIGGSGKKKAAAGGAGAIVLAIIVLVLQHFTGVNLIDQQGQATTQAAPASTREPARSAPAATKPAPKQPAAPAEDTGDDVTTRGIQAMQEAFRNGQSDIIVEAVGRVIKTLADDHDGDRHQRFILKTPTGQTVLVAHNIDLAPRLPVREGDTVRFKGEYEWSEQGGVIHWTHHDPQGRRDGGWIEHDGKRYE